jgi:serine/threonine-protein kinase RIO1
MNLLVKLASYGLIHCDFNEFNLMIDDECKLTLIDFPQIVSTKHVNGKEYFDRDVECVRVFFRRKFGYDCPDYPDWDRDVANRFNLDDHVRASGFSHEMDQEFARLSREAQEIAEERKKQLGAGDSDDDEDSDDEDGEDGEDEDDEEDEDDDDDDDDAPRFDLGAQGEGAVKEKPADPLVAELDNLEKRLTQTRFADDVASGDSGSESDSGGDDSLLGAGKNVRGQRYDPKKLVKISKPKAAPSAEDIARRVKRQNSKREDSFHKRNSNKTERVSRKGKQANSAKQEVREWM